MYMVKNKRVAVNEWITLVQQEILMKLELNSITTFNGNGTEKIHITGNNCKVTLSSHSSVLISQVLKKWM